MSLKTKILCIDKFFDTRERIYVDTVSFRKKNILNTQALRDLWVGSLSQNTQWNISLYVHIPFCAQICNFCMYNVVKLTQSQQIDLYLDGIFEYFDYFKDTFQWHTFESLYVGGGTPGILSEIQLDRFLSGIQERFNFRDNSFHTYEMHPASTTKKKLEILKKYGITRISIGVQSFDVSVLKKENRIHASAAYMKTLVDAAKTVGIQDINLDLIIGLDGQTEEDIIQSVIEMQTILPTSLTLYSIHENKEKSYIYKNDPLKFHENILLLHKKIFQTTNILDFYEFDDSTNHRWLRLQLKDNTIWNKDNYHIHANTRNSVFGAWYKASSAIWWEWKYENSDSYTDMLQPVTFESWDFAGEMSEYILRNFQYSISKVEFQQVFGEDFNEKFEEEIIYLQDLGMIRNEESSVTYIGPEHNSWYYGLYFLDIEYIIRFYKYNFNQA